MIMRNKINTNVWITLIGLALLISFAILVYSIFWSNPTKLGPGGVTFWFINIMIFVFSLVSLIAFKFRSHKFKSKGKSKSVILNTSVRTGIIASFVVTVLLALSSLRSLGIRDVVLFVLTVILVEVYLRTRSSKES